VNRYGCYGLREQASGRARHPAAARLGLTT